jgi:hypothetical protein
MLDTPKSTLLIETAPVLILLDPPATLLYLICRDKIFHRTSSYIFFEPSNSHDPGPSATTTDLTRTFTHFAPCSNTIDDKLLWTPVHNDYGFSNPHDPELSVLARQSPTLDAPAHLAYPICSNSPPFWTLGCITSGPSNPHDPGPSATVDSKFLLLNLMLDVPAQTMLEVLADFLNIMRRISLLL